MRLITFAEAIREALDFVMKNDRRVIVLGEGVDDPQGTFGTTLGLKDSYGAKRVIDMPLAENAATGIAIGACLAGLLPIAVHQRMDFLLLAMDQIVNHAAKLSYMFGGKFCVPLTIRCTVGMAGGMAGQHSQNLHALFTHIPGLKVVMPATAYDAKGLLLSSICDQNPVIFIENFHLYKMQQDVPRGAYFIPLGKGAVRRKGKDVTAVSFSIMLHRTLEAASILEGDGIDTEVIDLRTLSPLDEELILKSVKKTGRLVIIEPAVESCGFAAEITARVQAKLFLRLKCPIKRISFPNSPPPAAASLEKLYYPEADKIARIISGIFNGTGKYTLKGTS